MLIKIQNKRKGKEDKMDYWQECISEALDDAGLEASKKMEEDRKEIERRKLRDLKIRWLFIGYFLGGAMMSFLLYLKN